MRTHTEEFKNKIKEHGRQIDSQIIYNGTIISSDKLFRIEPVTNGNILKSVMKELDFETTEELPMYSNIRYKFGLLVDGEYEWIDFGDYIINSIDYNEDTKTYSYVAYDVLLLTMKEYVALTTNATFPMTIRDYIKNICLECGLAFKNTDSTFANYDKTIKTDLYAGLGYTYRDILDELAQVTASTICANEDNIVEIRYINDTNDTIDANYFKDINVSFGEKYGPVNSIVLSRSAESDNIYLKDEDSVEKNGLCEIKIKDNQIMNDNDRDTFLPDILDTLNGLEYYINDYSSTGIMYYELCDRYNVQIEDNSYSCILFNDEIQVTQGLVENIYTEMPKESVTDYTKADKTDRRINQAYIIVDKQNKKIEALTNEVNEFDESLTKLEIDVEGVSTEVKQLNDFRRESNGTNIVTTENAFPGDLVELEIKGQINPIYPSEDLYPSESLYPKDTNLVISNDPNHPLEKRTFTATGNPTYISDSGGYALEKDFIYGMSIQETRSGKNLYNINDVYNRADAFISIDSDDWITLTRNNSSGTSVSYVNNYVNPSELLKVDTTYYIVFEVKAVSGTGSINVTSLQATNAKGQFTTTNGYKLANLKAGDVKKITTTTLSDFSSCITMLRNFATFQIGESGSITYRISVFENETDADNFVYEKYGVSPSPDFPSNIKNVEGIRNLWKPIESTQTLNGITLTSYEDGSFDLKGTATANANFICYAPISEVDFVDGEYYFLHNNQPLNYTNIRCEAYNGTTWLSSIIHLGYNTQGACWKVVRPSEVTQYRFLIQVVSGATIDYKNIKIQLEKGKTQHSRVPYGSNYLVQKITGKNLCDRFLSNYMISNSGNVSSNTSWNLSDYIKVKQNEKYTFSHNDNTSQQSLIIAEFDENKTFIVRNVQGSLNENKPFELTTSANTKYVRLSYNNTFGNEKFQFERGTKTEYEPYKEKLITYDLQGNELCEINGVRDKIDLVSGTLTKRIGKVILNGSEDWVKAEKGYLLMPSTNTFVNRKTDNYTFYCNRFKIRNDTLTWMNIYECGFNANGVFWIRDDFTLASELSGWKTWLSENPVEVYYVLKEPQTIQLEPTKIITYESINNIYTESNVDVEEVDIEYYNDKRFNVVNLPIDYLNYTSETNCDIFRVKNGKATIERANGTIEDKGEVLIPVFEDYNKIFLESFYKIGAKYNIMYAVKNDFLDVFATKLEMKSSINQSAQAITSEVSKIVEGTEQEFTSKIEQTAESITQEVNANIEGVDKTLTAKIEVKVDKDKLISEINASADVATINASKINLNGAVTANNYFKINTDGSMEATNGKFTGTINIRSSDAINVIGSDGLLDVKVANDGVGFYDNNGNYSGLVTSVNTGATRGVGIGTYSGNRLNLYKDSSGNEIAFFNASSGVHAYGFTNASLESKKKNIEEFKENIIEKIKESKIYNYNYIDDKKNKQHIGLVIPDNGGDYKTPEEIRDDYGIDIYAMTAFLWKGVQEQQQIIEDLKNKIKELESSFLVKGDEE